MKEIYLPCTVPSSCDNKCCEEEEKFQRVRGQHINVIDFSRMARAIAFYTTIRLRGLTPECNVAKIHEASAESIEAPSIACVIGRPLNDH